MSAREILAARGRRSARSVSPVGRRIQALREASGLAQADFASSLGISRTTLGRYERAERPPERPFAEALCATYGASRDWLYEGASEPPPLLRGEPVDADPESGERTAAVQLGSDFALRERIQVLEKRNGVLEAVFALVRKVAP